MFFLIKKTNITASVAWTLSDWSITVKSLASCSSSYDNSNSIHFAAVAYTDLSKVVLAVAHSGLVYGTCNLFVVIIRALVWLLWWSGQRAVDYLLLICFGVAAACGLWMAQGTGRWPLAALFCSRRCNRRQACCKQQQPSAASQRPDHMVWHTE